MTGFEYDWGLQSGPPSGFVSGCNVLPPRSCQHRGPSVALHGAGDPDRRVLRTILPSALPVSDSACRALQVEFTLNATLYAIVPCERAFTESEGMCNTRKPERLLLTPRPLHSAQPPSAPGQESLPSQDSQWLAPECDRNGHEIASHQSIRQRQPTQSVPGRIRRRSGR